MPLNMIANQFEPLEGRKHCKIILLLMILLALSMLTLFVGGVYNGIIKSKVSIVFLTFLQLLLYGVIFYIYRIYYSICMKVL